MPHHDVDDDKEADDFDPEGPDPAEMDSSDEPDLDVCPHCRKLISEDAERCPHCGDYILAEGRASWTHAWVAIVVLIVCVALLIMYMR